MGNFSLIFRARFAPAAALFLLIAGPVTAGPTTNQLYTQASEAEQALRIFEARRFLAEAITQTPDPRGLQERHAWLLHRYEFREPAVSALEALRPTADDPRSIDEALAWNRWELGDPEGASAAFRRAYNLPDSLSKPREVYAAALERAQANLDEEIASLKQAADPTADLADGRRLVDLLITRGRPGEAATLSARLVTDHPHDAPLALRHSEAQLATGDLTSAIETMQSLVNRSPRSAYLHYRLGLLQQRQGEYERAAESFQRALDIDPKSIEVRRHLAETLAVTGRSQQAREALPAPGEPNGNTLDATLGRAHARHWAGDIRASVPHYEAALTRYPANVEALRGLAEASVILQRFGRAEQLIARAERIGRAGAVTDVTERLNALTGLRPLWTGGYYENESGFSRFDGGLILYWAASERIDLEAGGDLSWFDQPGFDGVFRQRAWLGAAWTPADTWRLEGRAGVSAFDHGEENLFVEARASWQVSDDLSLSVNYNHLDVAEVGTAGGYQIYNQATIGAASLGLRAHRVTPSFEAQLTEDLRWRGEFDWADYSDGNKRLAGWSELTWRLTETPRVELGYGYYFLDVDDPAPTYTEGGSSVGAYYDPVNLEAHTGILRLAHPLNENWEVGLEQRLTLTPKASGIGSSTFLFIEREAGWGSTLRLDLRYSQQPHGLDRRGETGYFDALQVHLLLRHTF